MRIALCDDEGSALHFLQETVVTFCQRRKLDVKIDLFSSGEDFLASPEPYDIVFMDVYMTGITGMETIQKWSASPQQQVVFTTVSPEYAVEAFHLNATHYLLKPLTLQAVSDAMERCLSRLGEVTQKMFSMKTAQGVVSLPMEQIMFVEVLNKVCLVHTDRETLPISTSLRALSEHLDPNDFLRVQRSYIVNMQFIDTFLFDRVQLRDGTEIMLNRNHRASLKKQYQDFLFRLARGKAT